MDLTFVLTRDEIYVPIAVRKPPGSGPFPLIVMGRGAGRGGVPQIEKQVGQLAAMQDEMIARGYVVVFVNYRNEIPHLYEGTQRAQNLADDVSGEGRTLKSAPTLDSDDLIAILKAGGLSGAVLVDLRDPHPLRVPLQLHADALVLEDPLARGR